MQTFESIYYNATLHVHGKFVSQARLYNYFHKQVQKHFAQDKTSCHYNYEETKLCFLPPKFVIHVMHI